MDDDQFELLARRLSDEVRDKVQSKLFRNYLLIGAAAIAGFTYANWDFMEDTKAEVRAKAEEAVDAAVAAATSDIRGLEKEVLQQKGRLEAEQARAEALRADVATKLSQLGAEAATIAKLTETVVALQDARRLLAEDVEKMKARTDSLSVLADELKKMAEALGDTGAANADEYRTIARNVGDAQEEIQAPKTLATVYLQFAGGARARAQRLSELLAASGFLMPGEERHAGAAGLREVRYYHAEDAEAAKKLGEATDQALKELGASARATTVRDLTNWSGQKPKPGVIELWVEI